MLGQRHAACASAIAAACLLLLCLAGCTAGLRAEVSALREQVGQLRDDVEALKEAVQGRRPAAAAHPRQRVTVIGQRGDALRVTVAERAVFVNGELVKEEELPDRFAQLAAGNPELRVVIAADRQVRHARMVRIMDAIKQAGLKRVSIAVQPAPR